MRECSIRGLTQNQRANDFYFINPKKSYKTKYKNKHYEIDFKKIWFSELTDYMISMKN